MKPVSKLDPQQIKRESERLILAGGGRICEGLPVCEVSTMRSNDAIINRALILFALLQIKFEASTHRVKSWLEKNNLTSHLTPQELALLNKKNADLSPQELTELYWHIESLWTLLWVGGLVHNLDFNQPVQDYLALLCPSLADDEDGSKFTQKMHTRPFNECFQMLDLYYRLHWWAADSALTGVLLGNFLSPRIATRRKALEWVMNSTIDWDDIDLST